MAPRWKRCLNATEAALPYAVGRLYVEARFSPESKRAALEMIHDVGAAFAETLPQLAWMDPATRDRARGKYERITERIGYPDRWRDISGLRVGRESHFENARAAAAFETARLLAKVGKPDDPAEWTMPPQLVNAGYNPLRNAITFPAAILQPPFFDPAAPAALSYGAIGTVMGHEITHGFDDEGRKFDADGRLREWWEPEVAARFEERAACLREQYSELQIEPGLAVDGALTLGENIADNGGLRQSWRAYQRWETRHGPGPGLGPLTDEQLFFVGHAQVWCELSTPESSRLLQRIDVHAPGFARTVGPIRNHPGFARAFACEPATPMNPADKCEVW
jgi:endothelin-converting enzyme/putative endopeptidase